MEMRHSPNHGGRSVTPVAALQRFAVSRHEPARERCELCRVGLAPEHRHLLETASHKIICACGPCALRFQQERRRKSAMPELENAEVIL